MLLLILLLQVLSPALLGRAHYFVNKLALPKGGATCTDLPYFDAPGKQRGLGIVRDQWRWSEVSEFCNPDAEAH